MNIGQPALQTVCEANLSLTMRLTMRPTCNRIHCRHPSSSEANVGVQHAPRPPRRITFTCDHVHVPARAPVNNSRPGRLMSFRGISILLIYSCWCSAPPAGMMAPCNGSLRHELRVASGKYACTAGIWTLWVCVTVFTHLFLSSLSLW